MTLFPKITFPSVCSLKGVQEATCAGPSCPPSWQKGVVSPQSRRGARVRDKAKCVLARMLCVVAPQAAPHGLPDLSKVHAAVRKVGCHS